MPRERARWTKAAALVALPVVVVAAFVIASYTPLFRLRDIRVEGATALSREQVIELAGVGPGTNVFHLNTAATEAALTADPWIAVATVERHLPDTVVIRVQERTPIAQTSAGSTPMAIAGDGVVLPEAPTVGLPEIRASIGELPETTRSAAARALSAMEPVLRARVGSVVAEPTGALVMDLAGGLTVQYGGPGDEVAKAAALRSVLSWAAGQGVALRDVDLTVPEAPSATLANGSTVTP
jgi:cell division protein FtsQ